MNGGRILGTGVDLVENRRMREVLQRWGAKFKDRVFLKNEQSYCEDKADPYRHYAARFAVKEAVSKAFGTGITPQLTWLDMEVIRADNGAPSVRLSRRARKPGGACGSVEILVSLAHTRTYAVAHALVVTGDPAARAGSKR